MMGQYEALPWLLKSRLSWMMSVTFKLYLPFCLDSSMHLMWTIQRTFEVIQRVFIGLGTHCSAWVKTLKNHLLQLQQSAHDNKACSHAGFFSFLFVLLTK